MKILVVDDNQIFLSQMKKYLSIKNFDVDLANGGKKAIEKLQTGKYSAVVLDLKMPDLPGIEVLKWARNHQIKSHFIVVTGYGDVESAVEAMKLGAIDYIQKPFDAEKLAKLLHDVCGKKKKRVTPNPFIEMLKEEKHAKIILITDTNPAEFERKYDINAYKKIWLRRIADDPLPKIMDMMRKFAEEERIIMIHSGLGYFAKTYGKEKLAKYLQELNKIVTEKNAQLFIVYKSQKEKMLLNEIYEEDIASSIDKVVRIYKNSTRRKILQLLETQQPLTYTQIMKELGIEYSSKLAFHLKTLLKMGIIEKHDKFYFLTPHGEHMAGILDTLISGNGTTIGKIAWFSL
jgi:ActR/RegA family two-component response regulator/DNA-binding HxlR family transcriptional regulator